MPGGRIGAQRQAGTTGLSGLKPPLDRDGAGGRTRTDTSSRTQDFESSASTNFTTPAGAASPQTGASGPVCKAFGGPRISRSSTAWRTDAGLASRSASGSRRARRTVAGADSGKLSAAASAGRDGEGGGTGEGGATARGGGGGGAAGRTGRGGATGLGACAVSSASSSALRTCDQGSLGLSRAGRGAWGEASTWRRQASSRNRFSSGFTGSARRRSRSSRDCWNNPQSHWRKPALIAMMMMTIWTGSISASMEQFGMVPGRLQGKM